MNANTPDQPDDLDRLLSDFFKAQLKMPWPAVRVPDPAEPAALVAVRNDSPATRSRTAGDPGNRARLTLAVSAAILLGGCWYLSNGLAPADRPANTTPSPSVGPGLKDAGASEKGVLPQIREDKARDAKDPAAGFVPGAVRLP
jgi:hypothetical protein